MAIAAVVAAALNLAALRRHPKKTDAEEKVKHHQHQHVHVCQNLAPTPTTMDTYNDLFRCERAATEAPQKLRLGNRTRSANRASLQDNTYFDGRRGKQTLSKSVSLNSRVYLARCHFGLESAVYQSESESDDESREDKSGCCAKCGRALWWCNANCSRCQLRAHDTRAIDDAEVGPAPLVGKPESESDDPDASATDDAMTLLHRAAELRKFPEWDSSGEELAQCLLAALTSRHDESANDDADATSTQFFDLAAADQDEAEADFFPDESPVPDGWRFRIWRQRRSRRSSRHQPWRRRRSRRSQAGPQSQPRPRVTSGWVVHQPKLNWWKSAARRLQRTRHPGSRADEAARNLR